MAVAAGLIGALSAGELEVDGEMHGDSALDEDIRRAANPDSPLKGEANLVIMPNIDAANISYNLIKMTAGEGVTIGPVLLGVARPVHVMTATATVRRVVNMTALAVVESMER
jgi:malate dehydrogenase (oxaloacetate-decarboxylating)(NADP+)